MYALYSCKDRLRNDNQLTAYYKLHMNQFYHESISQTPTHHPNPPNRLPTHPTARRSTTQPPYPLPLGKNALYVGGHKPVEDGIVVEGVEVTKITDTSIL